MKNSPIESLPGNPQGSCPGAPGPRRNPARPTPGHPALLAAFLLLVGIGHPPDVLHASAPAVAGVHVVPHVQSPALRYRRPPPPGLGARVQLFLHNPSELPLALPADLPVRFRGSTADELVASGAWTWHDTPSAWPGAHLTLPPGALTVWQFNGAGDDWGPGTRADLSVAAHDVPAWSLPVSLDPPTAWLSSVTFLGTEQDPVPREMIFHVANETGAPLRIVAVRLWVPADRSTWRVLHPGPRRTDLQRFPSDGVIPRGDRGGARVATGPLPLTYTALEVEVAGPDGPATSLWAHLRIKREVFDISGGWVADGLRDGNTLHQEVYLKTLRRMHVNAGMHQDVPGYTDNPGLYDRYPLKAMNRFQPIDRYDTEAVLPRIHAVEFLGEPQFGGGRPVPPMEVWRAFAPYQSSRLPTSVTHSEERIWRLYAGLSDYPHYDAYRVCAPAPDAWNQYDRWGGERIRWAAPLETIGDMTRSLRELNRPLPIAYWSQGAHHDWGRYGGRQRTSPTPDELRVQAWHGLAARITSLYWFNLSLKSLVKFRDLIDPITRVGREIRMLDTLLLTGDAYRHQVALGDDGRPSWDLSSVAGPEGALLCALDLDYSPDLAEKVLRFGPDRDALWHFPLPAHLRQASDVFRVDADGVHGADWERSDDGVRIRGRGSRVAIHVATADPGLRTRIADRHRGLLRMEADLGFDPAGDDRDFARLQALLASP